MTGFRSESSQLRPAPRAADSQGLVSAAACGRREISVRVGGMSTSPSKSEIWCVDIK